MVTITLPGGVQIQIDDAGVITKLDRQEASMSAVSDALAGLTAKVAEVATVDASIVTLVNGLAQQLRDLAAAGTVNPADLTALADQLEADNQSIRDAVTANTPPAPAP